MLWCHDMVSSCCDICQYSHFAARLYRGREGSNACSLHVYSVTNVLGSVRSTRIQMDPSGWNHERGTRKSVLQLSFSIIRYFLPNPGRRLPALIEKSKIKIAQVAIEPITSWCGLSFLLPVLCWCCGSILVSCTRDCRSISITVFVTIFSESIWENSSLQPSTCWNDKEVVFTPFLTLLIINDQSNSNCSLQLTHAYNLQWDF